MGKGFKGKKDAAPKTGLSLDQAVKSLSQAAKKARTFESQKIIRKLKKLKEEDGDHAAEVKDLEALLEAVKEVEPSFAARTSLRSYCHKHDLQHLLPAATEEAAKPDPSTPQGKALNRILANKHLHEALTSIAPKLDPMNTTPATSNSNAPVAGPSKSKQLAASKDAKPIAKKSKLEPAAASTFLPSLSTGFTLGDSDAEDDFPLSDGEQPDPEASQRRNRRGQRARRAIWEKKFGKAANHLKKSEQAGHLAQAAVDAKAAARGKKRRRDEPESASRSHTNPHHQHHQRAQNQDRERERPAPAQKRRKEDTTAEDEANMHPSWKARKAAAEKASLGVAGGGFSGTKITFDD